MAYEGPVTAAHDYATKGYVDDALKPVMPGAVFMPDVAGLVVSGAVVAGTRYRSFVNVPAGGDAAGVVVGVAGAAGNGRAALYSPDGTTRLGVRSTDHAMGGGFGTPDRIPFDSAVAIAAGIYLIEGVFSSASLQTVNGIPANFASATTGSYGTPGTSIVVPGTVTSMPLLGLYMS